MQIKSNYLNPCRILILMAFMISGIVSSQFSYAGNLFVDPASDTAYQKISDAMSVAKSGDVVNVRAGIYHENIILKDGVTIKGSGAGTTRIEYDGVSSVVFGKNIDGAKLEGVTLTYKGTEKRSLVFLMSTKLIISNCVLFGSSLSGIEAKDNSEVEIYSTVIKGNMGSGLFIYKGARLKIVETWITGNRYFGVEIKDNSTLKLSKSFITENQRGGVLARGEVDTEFENNLFVANRYNGIWIKEGKGSISENTIVNNQHAGIVIGSAAGGLIINNIILMNGSSVKIGKNKTVSISHNLIWNNMVADKNLLKTGNNISADPLLDEEYRLKSGSPAIKAGIGGIDIGAYPYEGPVQQTVSITPETTATLDLPDLPMETLQTVPPPLADPCEEAVDLYNKGVALSDFSENEIALYKKSLSLCPNSYKSHYNLGLVFRKIKKIAQAIVEFKETIRLNPKHADAHHNLAVVYDEMDKFEEARDEYLKAIKLEPSNPNTHFNLGGIYWALKKYDLAQKEFEKTLKIKSDHAQALKMLKDIKDR